MANYRNKNGKFHRIDGPAIERPNGTKQWYLNGLRHRVDGPAIEYPNGTKSWYLNGLRHRVDGPAFERPDDPNGYKAWYLNGKLHRTNGPAVKYPNGYKEWYLNGKFHRVDGPAIEYGYKQWWLNGNKLTEKEFNSRIPLISVSVSSVEEIVMSDLDRLNPDEVVALRKILAVKNQPKNMVKLFGAGILKLIKAGGLATLVGDKFATKYTVGTAVGLATIYGFTQLIPTIQNYLN